MADFLFSVGSRLNGGQLLGLLKQPYGDKAPAGWSLDCAWGSLAVLEDRIAGSRNRVSVGDWTFSWVGDLVVTDSGARVQEALRYLYTPPPSPAGDQDWEKRLRDSGLFQILNGAFAANLVTDRLALILTDPLASVQVYLGKNAAGQLVAVGTHPDLVACATGEPYAVDPVSICDFINTGTPCCPYTMHSNVVELAPGTVLALQQGEGQPLQSRQFPYWTPPKELTGHLDVRELQREFAQRWQQAVLSRCVGNRLAVQLSGGFDSRIVLAAIPAARECLTLTLCDNLNREARFARRVARCYGREWIPLRRDPEYLGRTAAQAIRFTGCEGEWSHGHSIGFAGQIEELGIDGIFTGLLMDNNFKGYYAQDVKRIARAGGLLPARFEIRPVDYINQVDPFCRAVFKDEIVQGTVDRRRVFHDNHFARQRQGVCEWLDGYPYSQASDNTGWVIERRLMPLRLPVMDRSLVELAFQLPMTLKAGGRFFDQAIVSILGPGRRIPSANDGVRAGSGHLSRMFQRGLRKLENTGRKALSRVGIQLAVPHSWHDFQTYWRESSLLQELRIEHGRNLQQWNGNVFKEDLLKALCAPTTSWQIGARLMQLAIWHSVIHQYRLPAASPDSHPAPQAGISLTPGTIYSHSNYE